MQEAEEGKKEKNKGSSKHKAASAEREGAASDADDSEEAEAVAQAGNEFGRGAHKKAKSTVASTARIDPTKATQRHVMTTRTAARYVMDTSQMNDVAGRTELDTHADTCVAGRNTVVLDLTGKVVLVAPFCEAEYDTMQDVPIATVATAYDCPRTGRTLVLIINEAIYLGETIEHTLLCPNQLRANGLRVNDCPRQYDPTSDRSIYVPESDVTIPLSMQGVISRESQHKDGACSLNGRMAPAHRRPSRT